MAKTYNNLLAFVNPESGGSNWDTDWYRNHRMFSALFKSLMFGGSVVSGLIVSAGAGLSVNYTSGKVKIDVETDVNSGSLVVAGATLEEEEVNFIWIDSDGVVNVTQTEPNEYFILLAIVDTDLTSVKRISDARNFQTSGSGSGITWSYTAANLTAVKNNGYFVNTTTGQKTIALMASPVIGDMVAVEDVAGMFNTNNCIVSGNGKKIMGSTENLVLDVKNQVVFLAWSGDETFGWRVIYAVPVGGVTRPFDILHVRDEKTQGTAGGASIAGTQTRTLNTVKLNEISGASVNGSNQITLPAGTYEMDIMCPVYGAMGSHKVRLYSVTDAAYIFEGNNESTQNSTRSRLHGVLTLTAQKVLEIRHYTAAAIATSGLGNAVSQGVEVYTDAMFKRRTA